MITTRICDSEYNPWQLRKYYSPSQPKSPRMSDRYEAPVPVQPEWQGHFSYLSQPDDNGFSRPRDNRNFIGDCRRPQSTGDGALTALDGRVVRRDKFSPEALRCCDDSLGPARRHSVADERPNLTDKVAASARGDSFSAISRLSRSSGPNHIRMVFSAESDCVPVDQALPRQDENAREAVVEEEVDIGGDDDAIAAESDAILRPQKMKERLAARRKMKRFRLTHQQTRFLMSEFAKQPHPDAAHRERLSREIPGLSPRQVQVWFQNRRAKIKRLTADDRDRMIRMRAVPDGFDNVQALHSAYGAVQGLVPPVTDGVDVPYGGHLLRPLIVDTRRHEEAYISPTSLTPSFGAMELEQTGAISGSEIAHASSLEGMAGGRSGLRPGPPMHTQEPMTRPTADVLQSPLRAGMAWKPGGFDYSHYHEAAVASPATERHHSAYHAGHMGSAAGAALGGFETPSYPAAGSYSDLQPPSHGRPRIRALSASLPLQADFCLKESPYRSSAVGIPSQPSNSDGGDHQVAASVAKPGHSMFAALHSPISSSLSAPLSLALPRSSHNRAAGTGEGQNAHLGSPMMAPSDFGRRTHGALTSQQPSVGIKNFLGTSPARYDPR